MKYKIRIIIFLLIAAYFGYKAYQTFFYTTEIEWKKLSLKTLNNQPKVLSEQDLSSAIIIFFQTWYPPCIAEMRLIQKHSQDFQFTNIYFITDEEIEKVESLKNRFHLYNLNFLISENNLQTLGIDAFPSVYIVRNNKIIESHKGAIIDETNFEDELYHLKKLLK